MKELSLHLLDVAKNSTAAGARNVSITLEEGADGWLAVTIADDGRGMSPEFLAQAEQTGGSLDIQSTQGVGTTLTARFQRQHLDCPPLGDLAGTVALLIQGSPEVELAYRHTTPRGEAALSTAELREILGGIPLSEPEVFAWIQEYLTEQEIETAVEAVPSTGIEGEII